MKWSELKRKWERERDIVCSTFVLSYQPILLTFGSGLSTSKRCLTCETYCNIFRTPGSQKSFQAMTMCPMIVLHEGLCTRVTEHRASSLQLVCKMAMALLALQWKLSRSEPEDSYLLYTGLTWIASIIKNTFLWDLNGVCLSYKAFFFRNPNLCIFFGTLRQYHLWDQFFCHAYA